MCMNNSDGLDWPIKKWANFNSDWGCSVISPSTEGLGAVWYILDTYFDKLQQTLGLLKWLKKFKG